MYRLNLHDSRRFPYRPPIDLPQDARGLDASMPFEELVIRSLWISSNLVSILVGQFPQFVSEADELFSIGCEVITATLAEEGFPLTEIGAVCQTRCRVAMEDHLNQISSMVSVSRSQRYRNRRSGRHTPRHIFSSQGVTEDSHAEIEIRDAAEVSGLDLDNLTPSERRAIRNRLI